MTQFKAFSLFVSILLLASSCAQLGSFQTGRTMEDELVEFGGAAEAFNVDESENSSSLGFGIVPNIRLWGRTALSDNLELGLSLSSGLNAQVDGKYQVYGDKMSSIAGSVGLGYEYQWTGEGANTMVHRGHVPLYISYHPNLYNAIYATPRYTFQYVNDDSDTHFIGSSLGYQFTFRSGIILNAEFSYYAPLQDGSVDAHLLMFGTGVKYRFFR